MNARTGIPVSTKMKTILLIEDDQRIVKLLTIRLKAAGYAVLAASNGVDGLKLALGKRPSLVILDMLMPVGSGESVAYRLKEAAPEIPFVFLTASKADNVEETAGRLGAAAFFEKPYDPSELLAGIERVLRQTAPTPQPSPPPATVRQQDGAKKRLLIIEDDRKIAMALGLRLRAAGFETTMAHDALAGVNSAVKLQPDLVLLDISMPAGNGFTVAERIQTLVPTLTPIIFLTAGKQPGLRERAEALGAVGFFEKPYDPERLVAVIRQTLGQS